jgi:DNA mismatch endonuclease, patch repair protein
MADTVSPEVRSRMMAGIRGKDTAPEMLVRRGLHRLGFRYRLHDRRLPGRPDLVFPRHGAVLFVNGCFWHGHGCHLFRMPGSRQAFWQAKIAANIARDGKSRDALASRGWRVGTVWECAVKGRTRQDLGQLLKHLAQWLVSCEGYISFTGKNDDEGHHHG